MDDLLNNIANITKAANYDIVAKQRNELLEENERLKDLEKGFYMNICRAYNAGKQNMINVYASKGSPDEGKMFLSSHEYFITEFPEFKTNVP
jgi:hypothetical protein